MNVNHPTTTLYFGFAFTYCKMHVYKKDEAFAKKILNAANVEWMEEKDCPKNRASNDRWQEFDTRLLLAIVAESLPKLLANTGASIAKDLIA